MTKFIRIILCLVLVSGGSGCDGVYVLENQDNELAASQDSAREDLQPDLQQDLQPPPKEGCHFRSVRGAAEGVPLVTGVCYFEEISKKSTAIVLTDDELGFPGSKDRVQVHAEFFFGGPRKHRARQHHAKSKAKKDILIDPDGKMRIQSSSDDEPSQTKGKKNRHKPMWPKIRYVKLSLELNAEERTFLVDTKRFIGKRLKLFIKYRLGDHGQIACQNLIEKFNALIALPVDSDTCESDDECMAFEVGAPNSCKQKAYRNQSLFQESYDKAELVRQKTATECEGASSGKPIVPCLTAKQADYSKGDSETKRCVASFEE